MHLKMRVVVYVVMGTVGKSCVIKYFSKMALSRVKCLAEHTS